MTTFYSTKVNKVVSIPNDKVCGYRFKNNATKTGWSSGVRAGKDNGVVNQKFSRFSTDTETNSKGPCAGNTNWINHKTGGGFTKPESAYTQFEIKRPSFIAGMSYVQHQEAQSIAGINHRNGMGNREIVRPSFLAPKIMARQVLDFDKLQAQDIEQFGNKVQFGEKTLTDLFAVAMPDSTDTKWIAEFARLEAVYRANGLNDEQIANELRVNLPLGRQQRTVKAMRNIGTSNLSTNDKLKEVKEEIDAGRAESRAQQAQLIGQLALILADTNAINALGVQQLTGLGQALARLNVPRTYKQLGLDARFVDIAYYNDPANNYFNRGMINLLIMANVSHDPNVSYATPLLNFPTDPNTGLPSVQLRLLESGMAKQEAQRRYLDLERIGLISRQQLRAFAGANPMGFDNLKLFSIQPAFR